jgi:hypothetical protein
MYNCSLFDTRRTLKKSILSDLICFVLVKTEMKITLRFFYASSTVRPGLTSVDKGRRNSITTEDVVFNPKPLGPVRLSDLITHFPQLENRHIAKGVRFLKDEDLLEDGDLLNVF